MTEDDKAIIVGLAEVTQKSMERWKDCLVEAARAAAAAEEARLEYDVHNERLKQAAYYLGAP